MNEKDNFIKLFLNFDSFLSKGGQLNRSNPSVRILYITPYILGVILTQFYSGVLHSYLTVQNSDPPFQSLRDVIEDGSYKISLLNPSTFLFYFQVIEFYLWLEKKNSNDEMILFTEFLRI